MQTEELIGPGVVMGNPQAYGVIYYLDDSLLYEYSFPVKKSSSQNYFPPLF
jgi:hypothetical protein